VHQQIRRPTGMGAGGATVMRWRKPFVPCPWRRRQLIVRRPAGCFIGLGAVKPACRCPGAGCHLYGVVPGLSGGTGVRSGHGLRVPPGGSLASVPHACSKAIPLAPVRLRLTSGDVR
jgi:hypothetical protein